MAIDKPIDEQNAQMTGEEYQKMLGTESYKQLLQADLQAENAKNVALKNTNMALQNAGLQGNAYGGTLASSTSNAYLTALQQNMSDFGNNIGVESNNNFEKITAQLSTAETKDDFLSRAKDLGLVNEDGTLNYANNGYLNEEDKKQLTTWYNSMISDYDKNETNNGEEKENTFNYTYGNQQYTTKLVDGKSAHNKDVDVSIGDYTVQGEYGFRVKTVGSYFSKDINDYPKEAKEGQIHWQETTDGKGGSFIIYDGKEWHILEMRTSARKSQYKELARKMGVDLSKYNYVFGVSETGGRTNTKNI